MFLYSNVILFTVPSLTSSLISAWEFPLGFHVYISFCINIYQSFTNSIFLVQLVIPLRVTICSKNPPPPPVILSRYNSTVCVPSLVRCAGASSVFCTSLDTCHFPNFQSQRRNLVSLVVSTLVCFSTSSHLGFIIWHIVLHALPSLPNQIYPNPVLYISSLTAHPFRFEFKRIGS